jgi:hypothetical protein
LALGVVGIIGCATGTDAPVGNFGNTVRFELDFGGGVTLSSVDYVMTGPNNFRRVGSLAVGDQPTVTATFQNLPTGQGYDIQVKGTATDDTNICKGEVMFDVSASMTATLQIPLTCSGQAAVTATVNVCPVIDELSAIPSEVIVGASIQLTVVAHDADNGPSPLSATWQTNGGMLGNLSTTGATFTCTAPGTFTIGVRISDGEAGNRCPDTSTLTLTCSAPTAAFERAAHRRGRTV